MSEIKNKNIKWWIGTGSLVVLFFVIGIFAYMKMSFIIKGVQIIAKVERTENSPLTKIVGKAQNANYISINGREIFIDKDGSFSEYVALIPGLSVVTIEAQDKFGKTEEKKFEMVYEGKIPAVAVGDNIINTN